MVTNYKKKTIERDKSTLGAEMLYEMEETPLSWSCAWIVKLGFKLESEPACAVRISKPFTVPSSRLT